MKAKVKKNKLLLISAILGSLYLIYLFVYFGDAIGASSSDTETIGTAIALAMVAPHTLCVGLAVLFNWIGFAMNLRWSALVAGIMYAVSILCMFIYFMFVIIEMILCFVAYAKMKKKVDTEATEIN